MARQLLTATGAYDRKAIIRAANAELERARRLGLEWDRAKCLEYVWRQARELRAAFLGKPLAPPRPRKTPKLAAPRKAPRKAKHPAQRMVMRIAA